MAGGKIHQGMERQLRQWRHALAAGEGRLGWKIGYNRVVDQQRSGLPSAMVGYLTQQRRIAAAGSYTIRPASTILVEAEIALLIGCDVSAGDSVAAAGNAISGYAAALELVDTSRTANDDIEEILAGNLFHEAVVIGAAVPTCDHDFDLSLKIDGEVMRTLEMDRLPEDFGSVVRGVAEILGRHGERLQAGDWIITGAATAPLVVHPGDYLELALSPLGELTLDLSAVG